MVQVHFYTKEVCSLCEEAYALLMMIQREYPFELIEHDIYQDDALLEKYMLLIPAVKIDEDFMNCEEINIESLEALIKRKVEP